MTKYVTNVRNLKSPFWASMLRNPAQRCLVPFSRFAEPKLGPDGKGTKDEHWFRVADREVAAFAGLWLPSAVGDAYAFLTCAPNPLVAPLHPKAMPVILAEEDYNLWLEGDVEDSPSSAMRCRSRIIDVRSRNGRVSRTTSFIRSSTRSNYATAFSDSRFASSIGSSMSDGCSAMLWRSPSLIDQCDLPIFSAASSTISRVTRSFSMWALP